MKRKLIKHGPASTIVVIPAKWLREQKLYAGDEISLEEDGDRIILHGTAQQHVSETTINIEGLDRTSIMFAIRSAYRQGFATINVRFTTRKALHIRTGKELPVAAIIQEETNRLIGVEVVSQKEHQITIQEISLPTISVLRSVYRKAYLVTGQLFEQLLSPEDADLDLFERHNTITRLVSYVIRIVATGKTNLSRQERYSMLHAVSMIDVIADIIKYLDRTQEHIDPDVLAHLSQAFSSVERLVFSGDYAALKDFQEHKAELRAIKQSIITPVIDVLNEIVVAHTTQTLDV